MMNVLAFVVLAVLACQCSAQIDIDIATPIEKSVIDHFESRCHLFKSKRHHKNIDPKNLYFHWYNTRLNKEKTLNLEQAAKDFHKEYDFKNNDPIYLYITGFNANYRSADVVFVKDGLTKLKNINYILLDTSFYLEHANVSIPDAYMKAVPNVYGIGQVLGDVLAKFIENGLRREQLHVAGHSVGAHLAGYAARRVYDIRREKLKRVSGIDPAAPCFDEMEIEDQISSDDAEYVDIYHSNRGVAGTSHLLGTADFFINTGGPRQPSCIDIPFLSQDCSHVSNCVNFWVDSALHSEKFMAQKCDSYERWKKGKCNDMPKARAGFFSEPCKGDYYIAYEFDYIGQVLDAISTAADGYGVK